LNVLLGAAAGCLVAVGAASLLEFLDDRLLTPARVAQFTGLETLGMIPLLPKSAKKARHALAQVAAAPWEFAGGNGHAAVALRAAESFRLLRASLQVAAADRSLRSLLITSSDPGDGKSIVAANLAAVMAQAGHRVLLVDADLRRPSLHELYGVPNEVGLTTLLQDVQAKAADALLPTGVNGLSLLTSGSLPPNPGELLVSPAMRARLAELCGLADVVIFDSPPALAVSDAAVLSGLVDSTVLVVNAQRTRGPHGAHTVATLQRAGAHILGIVVNRAAAGGVSYAAYYSHLPELPGASLSPISN
jgi:capsular exopolysaccharide synthesis family protein